MTMHHDILTPMEAQRVHAVQSRWNQLTSSDLAGVRTKTQLVARLVERYGMANDVAVEDVETWIVNRGM